MFNIVFISYNEPNADSNWVDLKNRFPDALRLHGVKGIHNAHRNSAKGLLSLESYTNTLVTEHPKNSMVSSQYSHFWVVDGDSTIVEDFDFTPPSDLWEDAVYVYRAQNPVTGASYGYGGIKLLPLKQTAEMVTDGVDMTTSISKNFFVVDQIASVTNFNTDPFNAWKSAFRECVKLSSKIIDRQQDKETENRLNDWLTFHSDKPFAQEVIQGAVAGKEYGRVNKGNSDALAKLNDFNWLEKYFNS